MNTLSQQQLETAVHKSHCFNDIMDEDYGCKYGPDSQCPVNPKLDEVLSSLSLLEQQVLRDLTEIGYDWYQGYSAIDFRGHEKKEIKKVIEKLKSLNLIEFARGLMMEDENMVAGSGWHVIKKHDVIEYFENTESFDEAMTNYARLLPVGDYEKIKAAHEREIVGRFR